MKSRARRIVALLVIALLSMAGLLPVAGAEAYPGKNAERVLRIAGEHPPVVQFDGNPNSEYGSGGMMGTFLYEGMFSYTRSTDGLRNRLAKDMVHEGNKTTITLRDDVYYNDGVQFTAKDVWCCLMIDYAQRINQWITDVEIIDDYTLKLTWTEPMLIDEIRDIYLAQNQHAKMPYHIYGQFADNAAGIMAGLEKTENPPGKTTPFSLNITDEARTALTSNFEDYKNFSPPNKQPVGTGPYMLDKMTDNEVVMKRNPYFYEPAAYGFESLVFKKVTPEQAVAMIKNGELDYYESALPVDMMHAILESNPDIVYYPAYDPAGNGFMFDQTSDTAPMADKAFRQAICYAVDKDPLRQAGCYYGTTAEGISSVGIPYNTIEKWVSPDVVSQMRKYAYSPETAKQLLTEAGYEKVDGWWRNKDGSIIKIEMVAPADWQPAGVTNVVASLVQNQLLDFGLQVEVKLLPFAVYWSQCDQNMYDMCWDYVDVTWLNLYPNGPMDSHFVRSRLPKGFPRVADDGRSLNLQLEDYNGEEFDVLMAINQLATERDTAKAQTLIDQLVWAANEYAYSIEFYQLITGAFWNRAYVKGFARGDEIDAYDQLMPLNTTGDAEYDEKLAEYVFNWDNSYWYNLVPNTPD